MRIRHKSRHPTPLASNRRRMDIQSTTSHLLHLSFSLSFSSIPWSLKRLVPRCKIVHPSMHHFLSMRRKNNGRLNGLEAANYQCVPLYKYVKKAEDCFAKSRAERKGSKASTLYHLSKYLDRNKTKVKQPFLAHSSRNIPQKCLVFQQMVIIR